MSDSRARIWFALFVLVVFCLGGAGGFILGRHVPPFPGGAPGDPFADGRGFPREGGPGRRGGPPLFGRGPGGPGGPLGLPPEAAGRLADQLQLDEGQRAQLRQIMENRRPRLEQVHREARERFDAEQRELRAAIRALLRPDQVQRFDQFINGR
jgi:hypothetical protein